MSKPLVIAPLVVSCRVTGCKPVPIPEAATHTLLVISNLGRNPIQNSRFSLQGGLLVGGSAQEIWHQPS